MLAIHVNTVDKHINHGLIKAVRVGGRTMIPVSELERLISEGSAPLPRAIRVTAAEAWEQDHPKGG